MFKIHTLPMVVKLVGSVMKCCKYHLMTSQVCADWSKDNIIRYGIVLIFRRFVHPCNFKQGFQRKNNLLFLYITSNCNKFGQISNVNVKSVQIWIRSFAMCAKLNFAIKEMKIVTHIQKYLCYRYVSISRCILIYELIET